MTASLAATSGERRGAAPRRHRLLRLVVLVPLAVWVFVTCADASRQLEAVLASTLLGDRAQPAGNGTIVISNADLSGIFALRVTRSCSVLPLSLVLAIAAVALVPGRVHRRVAGLALGVGVVVLGNQARICGLAIVRERWGPDAALVAHEWAGTLATVGAAALGLAVLVAVSCHGPRAGARPPSPAVR